MNVKQQAIRDIKKSLRQQSKVFLAFRAELDSVMDNLVKEELERQQSIHKFKKGDTIVRMKNGKPAEELKVLDILDTSYLCKIINGKAFIPFSAEWNYELLETVDK